MKALKYTRSGRAAMATLAAAAMASTVLAGCSSDKNDDPATKNNAAASQTAQTRDEAVADNDNAGAEDTTKQGGEEKKDETTVTIPDEEARALDSQGLYDGVIARENGVVITRDGNRLTITPDRHNDSVLASVSANKDNDKVTPPINNADNKDNINAGNNGNNVSNTGDNATGNPGTGGGNLGGGGNTGTGGGGGDTGNPGTGGGSTETPGGGGSTGTGGGEHVTTHEEWSKAATAYLSAFRMEVLNQVNAERAKEGLQPLVPTKELTAQAQEWASYLSEKHIGSNTHVPHSWGEELPDGAPAGNRGTGIAFGETISIATEPDEFEITASELAQQTVDSWMNSPLHKKIIMSGGASYVGIGTATNVTDGKVREVTVLQVGSETTVNDTDKKVDYTGGNPNSNMLKDGTGNGVAAPSTPKEVAGNEGNVKAPEKAEPETKPAPETPKEEAAEAPAKVETPAPAPAPEPVETPAPAQTTPAPAVEAPKHSEPAATEVKHEAPAETGEAASEDSVVLAEGE